MNALKPGQFSEAARLVGMRVETIRQHAWTNIEDLILKDSDGLEYIQIRGLTRRRGILAKTATRNVDAAAAYYHDESVVSPGKHDVVPDPANKGETLQKRFLNEKLKPFYRQFVVVQKQVQRRHWEGDLVDCGGLGYFDSLAVSTLLHSTSDDAYVMVALPIGALRIQKYDPGRHSVMQVRRKRSCPVDKVKRAAFEASLTSIGKNPTHEQIPVCEMAHGAECIAVCVLPWTDRRKGKFKLNFNRSNTVVIPPYLVRGRVKNVDLKGEFLDRVMPRKLRKFLYETCRVFHMSYGIFSACRPKDVYFGQREGCACVYCLRREYMALGLVKYADFLRTTETITSEEHDHLSEQLDSASIFYKKLLCTLEDDVEDHNPACICAYSELSKQEEADKREGLLTQCEECGGFVKLAGLFGSASAHFFNSSIDSLIPDKRKANLTSETPVWLEQEDAGKELENKVGNIKYMRYTRTYQMNRDRTSSKSKEYVSRSVPLDDFWKDFVGFYPIACEHSGIARNQSREFGALKSFNEETKVATLPRQHFRVVMDFLQQLNLQRGQKATQQEFFAQLGITLCVLSYSFDVRDCQNIDDTEKVRLLAFFKELQLPPIVREEHFYCSHEKERGQGMVQNIVADAIDYFAGDGRWAKEKKYCSADRQKLWAEDNYYNGQGAGKSRKLLEEERENRERLEQAQLQLQQADEEDAGASASAIPPGAIADAVGVAVTSDFVPGLFVYGIWFMDGCGADFKCAAFFLFISVVALMRMTLRLCYFAECHGKTDEGDAGGAAFKRWCLMRQFSTDRSHDSVVAVVADARAHRSKPSDPDFFQRGTGTGVYRYYYHCIGMRGLWKINRRVRQAKDSANIVLEGTAKQFQISNIHDVITSGFANSLLASSRCCFSCSKCIQGKYLECEKSKKHAEQSVHYQVGRCSNEFKAIDVLAKSVVDPYNSKQILELAQDVFNAAGTGDVAAVETQSDVESFWLVRVVNVFKKLSKAKVSEIGEGEEKVTIKCKRGEPALEVTKFFYSRNEAISTFCEDTQKRLFYVPLRLLRVGKIQLVKSDTTKGAGSLKSRAAVSGDGVSEMPDFYYSLKNTTRQVINLRCRCEVA